MEILLEKSLYYSTADFKTNNDKAKELYQLMLDGTEDWHKYVPGDQWDNIPLHATTTAFKFKGKDFPNYDRIVNS